MFLVFHSKAITTLIRFIFCAQFVTRHQMACGGFGGLMTKYYIRVGLLSDDNETSWKPAQPLMAGPLCFILKRPRNNHES